MEMLGFFRAVTQTLLQTNGDCFPLKSDVWSHKGCLTDRLHPPPLSENPCQPLPSRQFKKAKTIHYDCSAVQPLCVFVLIWICVCVYWCVFVFVCFSICSYVCVCLCFLLVYWFVILACVCVYFIWYIGLWYWCVCVTVCAVFFTFFFYFYLSISP